MLSSLEWTVDPFQQFILMPTSNFWIPKPYKYLHLFF